MSYASAMNKLSSNTVRLIASSQVITSVFSVVKELLENSLDAGAKCIEIKLENYGFNRIEVRDNGCGIDKKDVEFMALPHYTSKISSSEDLNQLQTYGFRGEALGALCAVADVTITTKTVEDEAGIQYTVNKKGEVVDRKPSHLGTGTTVTALNLFKNMPVRKQYYSTAKKCREELKRVEDLVIAYSIIRHDVRFWLRHNKDMVFQSTAVSSSRDVLIKVIGTAAMASMEKISRDWIDPELRIEVYLPKKSSKWQLMSRTNKDKFFFYVNKRPVEMKSLEKEVKAYYNKALGCENRWPLGFISLQVPPENVDVNLEPNKNKVLLQSQGDVVCRLMDLLGELYGSIEATASPSKQKPCSDDSLDSGDSNMSNSSLLGCGLPQPLRHNTEDSKSTHADIQDEQPILPILSDEGVEYDASAPPMMNFVTSSDVAVDKHSAMDTDDVNQQGKSKTMDSDLSSMGDSIIKAGSSQATSLPPTQNISNFNLLDDDFMSSTPMLEDFGIESSDISKMTVDICSGNAQRISMESLTTIAQVAQNVVGEQKQLSDNEETDSDRIRSSTSKAKFTSSVNSDQHIEENWSKGTCLTDKDGKNIQPVALLTECARPERSIDDTSNRSNLPSTNSVSSSSRNSISLNSYTSPLVNTTPLAKKKLPTATTPDQPSLFEVMGSSIRKPTTAFIFFSKEIRPRVMKENPGASFQDVAKLIGEKWNKLSSNEKAKYENMMSADVNRYRDEKRKLSDTLKTDIKNSKKQKVDEQGGKDKGAAVKTKAVEEERRKLIPEVTTDFSLAKLKQLYDSGGNISRLANPRSTKLRLIAQMKTAPVWLGVQDEQICAFYPVRAQETLIYERLLANHTLSADRLENPIRLLPSMFSTKLWLTMLGLSKSETPRTDSYVYYDDPRLLKNGFSIRQYEKCEELYVEIVGMFEGMNLYGISDLQEIFQAITDNPSCQLQQCRSNKIKQYLQGEAVRMARQLPQRLSCEETKGVLQEVQKQLPVTTTFCFHKKPFLKTLYDLQSLDVTLSQGSTLQDSGAKT